MRGDAIDVQLVVQGVQHWFGVYWVTHEHYFRG